MLLKIVWGIILSLQYFLVKTEEAAGNKTRMQQKSIEMSMDNTVKPCDDFYSYACGNYAAQHSNPNYQEITGYMDYQYNTKLLNLMDTLYQHEHQQTNNCQTFVEKSRVYLKSCLSETQRNVTKYFDEIKPGEQLNWPILQELRGKVKELNHLWDQENTFDVWSLLGQLQSYGLNNVLINQEILVDAEGQLNIMLEPAYTENNTTLPETIILQVLLSSLGIKQPKRIMYHLQQLKETNQKLLDILDNTSENYKNLQMDYSDLATQYPNLNLTLYLKNLMEQDIPLDTVVIIRNSKYFQYLNDNMWQILDRQKLCNYLMMKFLYYLAEDGTTEFKPLSCIKDLRNKMDLAVNYLYYYHIYAPNADLYAKDIENLRQQISKGFEELFQKNNLNLSSEQILQLKDKLLNIRINIGNLPLNVNFSTIEDFYGNINFLFKNNYYKNHLILLKHRFAKSLHYAQNQTFFIVPNNHFGSSSGAIYVAKQNMIILPFGSLQYPLYDLNYHDLYKYSLLGFILAHEFTHAFDTTGLNFNSVGLPLTEPSDILENENFLYALDCLQSQLFTESLDERVADIVGIRVIYKSYKNKFNQLKPTSLKADWNRVFFLNLAQFFCGKSTAQFIDHDTDAQRLNEIAKNSRGFAEAFKCPPNSNMNPKDKCQLY